MKAQLTIIMARGIKVADITGTSDEVKFETKQTKKMKTNTLSFKVTPGEVIKFDVFNHDHFSRDDDLGNAKFTVPQLNASETYYDILPISVQGYLYVSINFTSSENQIFHHKDPKAKVALKIVLKKVVNSIKIPFEPAQLLYMSDCDRRKMCVKISSSLTDEQNSVTFDTRYIFKLEDSLIIKGKVGEQVKFRVGCFDIKESHYDNLKLKYSRTFLEVYEGKWILPGLVDDKLVCERILITKNAKIYADITCLHGDICKDELTIVKVDGIIAVISLELVMHLLNSKHQIKKKNKLTFVIHQPTHNGINLLELKQKIGSKIEFNVIARSFSMDKSFENVFLGEAKFTIPNDLQKNDTKEFQLDIIEDGKLFIELKRIRTISPMFTTHVFNNKLQCSYPPGYTFF
ncbi:Synaptotagmin [Entamoeba marina]